MAKQSYDEEHWYWGYGWQDLRASIVRLAVEALGELTECGVGGGAADKVAAALVDDLIRIIEARRRATLRDRAGAEDKVRGGSFSKWDYALSLFGDVAPLVKAIAGDALLLDAIAAGEPRAAALVRLLRQFLERARRELAPTTPHRRRVWEKLDEISRAILAGDPTAPRRDRCVEEHFRAVRGRLAGDHAGDKNFDISLDHVRAYFHRFCPDCDDDAFGGEDAAGEGAPLDDVLAEPGESFSQAAYEDFKTDFGKDIARGLCLKKLADEEPELWEVVMVESRWQDRIVMTREAYCAARRLTRYAYERKLRQGLAILADCVSALIEFQTRRWL